MNRRKFLLGTAAASLVTVAVPSLVLPSRTLAMAEPNRFYSIPERIPERVIRSLRFTNSMGGIVLFIDNLSDFPATLTFQTIPYMGFTTDPMALTVKPHTTHALGPFPTGIYSTTLGMDVEGEVLIRSYNPRETSINSTSRRLTRWR
jgi:hypothetical protein